jgi:hypothetical protein
LGEGYFFRRNGEGFDLRRNVADANGERKQKYVGYLSAENWKQMTRENRKDAELRKALSDWMLQEIGASN